MFSAASIASVFYKRLASQLSELHNKPYFQVLCLIRCQLSFSLLRSAIMCLRSARSSKHHPVRPDISSVDLALSEGRLIHKFNTCVFLLCFVNLLFPLLISLTYFLTFLLVCIYFNIFHPLQT